MRERSSEMSQEANIIRPLTASEPEILAVKSEIEKNLRIKRIDSRAAPCTA